MAEFKGFEATEKRQKKAIEEGNTFKVPYFYQTIYFSLFISISYIILNWKFTEKLENIKQCVINPFDMIESCIGYYVDFLVLFCFLPMFLSLFIVVALILYSNKKHMIVWQLVKIDFKKLNAVTGVMNFFSAFKDCWISILKFGFVLIAIVYFFNSKSKSLINNFYGGLDLKVLNNFFVLCILSFLLGAIVEFFVKKRQYRNKLSMSIDEVKREYKEEEGDPMIKSKRRSLHEALLMQKIEEKVKKSKVIIVD